MEAQGFGFTRCVQPTKRTLTIAALGLPLAALPIWFGAWLWIAWGLAWAVLLLCLAYDLVTQLGTGDFEVEVAAPASCGIATDLELEIAISRRTRSRRTLVDIHLDLSGPSRPLPVRSCSLATPGSTRISITPTRRGELGVDTLWLRWRGPLGLLERTWPEPLSKIITILPDFEAVRRQAIEFASHRDLRAGLRIERYLGDGSEFDSLREFMPGFDRRNIDWRSSARHRKLLSRHFRAERDRQVVIAFDSGRLMSESIEGLPRLDHAIHAGLLVAMTSTRAGDRVGFYNFDARPRGFSEPRAGPENLRAFLALSSAIRYCEDETNFTLGLTHLLERLHRRSLVVVLTDFTDAITAELMLENLTRLASRHLVIFVSLADPLLDRFMSAAPADLPTLGRAVVAETLLRERETVVNTLKQKGIHCIDASPRDVNSQLLNRYLEVKRRELVG